MHGSAGEATLAIRAFKGRVDGLLIMSPYADCAFLEANSSDDTPTVLMNTPVRGQSISAFCLDNRGGARDMVQHLFDCGHRNIAFIGGPEDNFDAAERLAGFQEALAALQPDTSGSVLRGDFSEESGYRAGQRISALTPRPDAVFAANDMMALGCLFSFNKCGIRVPDEIALAGFDDIPVARFVSPALTTVRVRMAELGDRALTRLADAIATPGSIPVSTETLAADLVIRASSGARPLASPRMPVVAMRSAI